MISRQLLLLYIISCNCISIFCLPVKNVKTSKEETELNRYPRTINPLYINGEEYFNEDHIQAHSIKRRDNEEAEKIKLNIASENERVLADIERQILVDITEKEHVAQQKPSIVSSNTDTNFEDVELAKYGSLINKKIYQDLLVTNRSLYETTDSKIEKQNDQILADIEKQIIVDIIELTEKPHVAQQEPYIVSSNADKNFEDVELAKYRNLINQKIYQDLLKENTPLYETTDSQIKKQESQNKRRSTIINSSLGMQPQQQQSNIGLDTYKSDIEFGSVVQSQVPLGLHNGPILSKTKTSISVPSGQEQTDIQFGAPSQQAQEDLGFYGNLQANRKGELTGQQQSDIEFGSVGQSQVPLGSYDHPIASKTKLSIPVLSGQEQTEIHFGSPSQQAQEDLGFYGNLQANRKGELTGQQQSHIEFGSVGQSQVPLGSYDRPTASKTKLSIPVLSGQEQTEIRFGSPSQQAQEDLGFYGNLQANRKGELTGQQQSDIEFGSVGQSQVPLGLYDRPTASKTKLSIPVLSGQEQTEIQFGSPSQQAQEDLGLYGNLQANRKGELTGQQQSDIELGSVGQSQVPLRSYDHPTLSKTKSGQEQTDIQFGNPSQQAQEDLGFYGNLQANRKGELTGQQQSDIELGSVGQSQVPLGSYDHPTLSKTKSGQEQTDIQFGNPSQQAQEDLGFYGNLQANRKGELTGQQQSDIEFGSVGQSQVPLGSYDRPTASKTKFSIPVLSSHESTNIYGNQNLISEPILTNDRNFDMKLTQLYKTTNTHYEQAGFTDLRFITTSEKPVITVVSTIIPIPTKSHNSGFIKFISSTFQPEYTQTTKEKIINHADVPNDKSTNINSYPVPVTENALTCSETTTTDIGKLPLWKKLGFKKQENKNLPQPCVSASPLTGNIKNEKHERGLQSDFNMDVAQSGSKTESIRESFIEKPNQITFETEQSPVLQPKETIVFKTKSRNNAPIKVPFLEEAINIAHEIQKDQEAVIEYI